MAGVGGEARRVEARIADIVSHLDLWGIIGAAALFTLGLTPSILPRDWLYQGLVSGIAAGLGYTLGIALKLVWYRLVVRYVAPRHAWLDATTWPARRYRLVRLSPCGISERPAKDQQLLSALLHRGNQVVHWSLLHYRGPAECLRCAYQGFITPLTSPTLIASNLCHLCRLREPDGPLYNGSPHLGSSDASTPTYSICIKTRTSVTNGPHLPIK